MRETLHPNPALRPALKTPGSDTKPFGL